MPDVASRTGVGPGLPFNAAFSAWDAFGRPTPGDAVRTAGGAVGGLADFGRGVVGEQAPPPLPPDAAAFVQAVRANQAPAPEAVSALAAYDRQNPGILSN